MLTHCQGGIQYELDQSQVGLFADIQRQSQLTVCKDLQQHIEYWNFLLKVTTGDQSWVDEAMVIPVGGR